MAIVDLLAPIFLLIALGAAIQRGGLMDTATIAGINRVIYWVGLPAAIFHSLVTAENSDARLGALVGVLIGGTLGAVGLAWGLARGMGIRVAAQGTFVQAAYRGNLSFVGLPLLLTVPGIPRAPAVLALAPMLIVYNALAVGVLMLSQHAAGWRMLRPIIVGIARNPIIIASAVGALWHELAWPLWPAIERTVGALGKMTLPLALLTIGAALMTVPIKGNRLQAGAAALFKSVVSPAIGYGLGRWMGLNAGEMLTVMLLMACPSAAISYTMVKQLGGDEGLAASTIVFSTLMAVPALALVLAWFAV